MSLFALSDLHLSLSNPSKSMGVFGSLWKDYEEKIKSNWNRIVADDDLVIIAGDVSWSTYLRDSLCDFRFIENLRGTKLICKGNHDYWWSTLKKHRKFFDDNNIKSIDFIHNNSFVFEGVGIFGSRGYISFEMCETDEDKKIYERELQRLENSYKTLPAEVEKKAAVLHYPPDENFRRLLAELGADICIFGHIHDRTYSFARFGDNIQYYLTSCDYLDFSPLKISL